MNHNMQEADNFKYLLEQFGDIKIMRYTVPGFEELDINKKRLLYFLSEAALCGRDILFDQNFKYNLLLRKTLEGIYNGFAGSRESAEFSEFVVYLKKIWFANGIHHHYSSDKFIPGFTPAYYHELLKNTPAQYFPATETITLDQIKELTEDIIFNKDLAPFKKYQNDTDDLLRQSAVNFYEGVTQKEIEAFYDAFKKEDDHMPVSFGLNSRLTKKDGVITEETYKVGGLYTEAIEKIVYWLKQAVEVAENETQQQALQLLIQYYQTGDLKTWDVYNIKWLQDLDSLVDVVNGFIETYEDPLGIKGTWESIVNFKNLEATKRTDIISANAQWFEDHSPVDPRFKKKEVRGVSAKVINAVQLGGDCFPSTPIGINLPNADWIRARYGSKSVTIENITYAHHQASLGSGMLDEFTYTDEERRLAREYGFIADNLHTDLHECLGHGSGQLLKGVSPDVLKNYHSPLEEARADLFALYYMMDPKLVALGILPCEEAAKAEYNSYIRNGLMTQLVRIEPGKTIEQAHMRCRSLIAHWVFEKGAADKVIEQVVKEGRTYFVINDHHALRSLFGDLLKEVQRIKSEGDYAAGKQLVEQYGVQIDPKLHAETLERFKKLNIAPFGGFVNPKLIPVIEDDVIKDVTISYPDNYTLQMLEYSVDYSFL
ncbi:MAG: dihydrofolate reductase [Bacteroidetes bacterium]|nr:dihydrofolate reductase [Bacteroidota bacterium]